MSALAAQSESDINRTTRSRGLSFKTTMGNVLTLTPPLTLTDSELDRALDILDECLGEERTGRA